MSCWSVICSLLTSSRAASSEESKSELSWPCSRDHEANRQEGHEQEHEHGVRVHEHGVRVHEHGGS